MRLGIRKRRVKFLRYSDPSEEKESLMKAIRNVYKDVLTESESFVVLIKSEQFHGEFEELHGGMMVDTNSVVEVSVEQKTHKDDVSHQAPGILCLLNNAFARQGVLLQVCATLFKSR